MRRIRRRRLTLRVPAAIATEIGRLRRSSARPITFAGGLWLLASLGVAQRRAERREKRRRWNNSSEEKQTMANEAKGGA